MSADGPPGAGHVPVLLAEVLAAARVRPGHRWVDGTFGRGGHSGALLEQGAQVLGLDQDGDAEASARALEARWPVKFRWMRRNFKELKTCCRDHGWDQVEGVLLDLGVSSPQLDDPARGFSFRGEGPLDMRMDRSGGPTAADVVNEFSESELSRLFYEQGGERDARRVARVLVARRARAPFRTTTDLADVVAAALPHRRVGGLHPATKVFQALRIAVNREEEALMTALPQAVEILRPGAVLAVISFHSGEDRVVKQFLRERAAAWLETPQHPNTLPNPHHHLRDVKRYLPTEEEIEKNPRARSARLRVAVRNEEADHMSRNRMKNSQSLHWMGVVKWILVIGLPAVLALCYMLCKNQNLHLAEQARLVQNQLDSIEQRNEELAADLQSMKSPRVLERRLAEMHSTLVPWGDARANWVRLDQNTRARLARIGTTPQATLNLDSSVMAASGGAPVHGPLTVPPTTCNTATARFGFS